MIGISAEGLAALRDRLAADLGDECPRCAAEGDCPQWCKDLD